MPGMTLNQHQGYLKELSQRSEPITPAEIELWLAHTEALDEDERRSPSNVRRVARDTIRYERKHPITGMDLSNDEVRHLLANEYPPIR